jgi:hypothetical protein
MGATAVAAIAMRAERHLIAHLRDAGATTPERATPLPPMHHLGRRRLTRLVGARVIHETRTGYWLDEPAYQNYRADRRTILLVLLGILSTVAVGMLLTQAL